MKEVGVGCAWKRQVFSWNLLSLTTLYYVALIPYIMDYNYGLCKQDRKVLTLSNIRICVYTLCCSLHLWIALLI